MCSASRATRERYDQAHPDHIPSTLVSTAAALALDHGRHPSARLERNGWQVGTPMCISVEGTGGDMPAATMNREELREFIRHSQLVYEQMAPE